MFQVGLHGRNDVRWKEEDYQVVPRAKLDMLKTMSQTDVSVYDRLRRENPELEFIVRLYDDRFGHNHSVPRVSEFVGKMLPIMNSLRPYAAKFEIHNEPNHIAGLEGFGNTDKDARDWLSWYNLALPTLKEVAPWAKFGFPGLANGPAHRDLAWLDICRDAILASDWLGCHVYWQYDNRTNITWGQRHRRYNGRFPHMPIHITEFGDSTPGLSSETMADQYVAFYQECMSFPYLKSAASFIGSSQDPSWWPFVWIKESGEFLPVVDRVGAMPREMPGYEVVDLVAVLPKHKKKRYGKRPLSAIRNVVVHHSGVTPKAGAFRIAAYHIARWDWAGIGYAGVVKKSGRLLKTQDLTTISYHAGPANLWGVGICFLGSFMGHVPPEPQLDAGAWYIAQILKTLNLDVSDVIGHKEVMQTACPGKMWLEGQKWKKLLKDRIRSHM